MSFFRVAFILTIILFTFDGFWAIRTVFAACDISGTVYQDYNASGTRDALEPGQPGIVVTVYETSVTPPGVPPPPPASLIVGTATTDANGDYSIASVPTTGQVRVEFTEIPPHLRSGRFGAANQSKTTTTFVDCVGVQAGVNLAVNSPGEYCNLVNVRLGTSCYSLNDQLTGPSATEDAFYTFSFDAAGDSDTGPDPKVTLALSQDIGTTYGLGYHRSSDSFLVASYMKRHVGFGPNASGTVTTTGAIYRISPASSTNPALVNVSVFMDFGTATGNDPHPTSTTSCFPGGVAIPGRLANCWQYDNGAFDAVGKMAFGDLDISEDDNTMYVVNLESRTLLAIPLIMTATGPTPGAPSSFLLNAATLPGLTTPGTACPADDFRPFGLGVHAGRVFVGSVCSAQSSNDRSQLRAYVHSMDALNPGLGFRLDLTFALDYPRGCVDGSPACTPVMAADWNPWTDTWPPNYGIGTVYPQPMLADIVFDRNDMVLGFRDRWGDMAGNAQPEPFSPTSSDSLQVASAGGDILRACDNGAGGWTLEDNADCGGTGTGGAGNGEGPDTALPPVGGEYYYQDMNAPGGGSFHDEITLGGLVDIPGTSLVASTAFDPLPPSGGDDGLFDGGVVWFNNNTGTRARSYRLLNDTFASSTGAGKTNGLGDLEAICGPPPLEIGNRVWEDLDRNGVQDPGETPLGGVVLRLYMITDTFGRPVNQLVGQTTTNADGEYYFNQFNVLTTGVLNGVPIVETPYVNFADTNANGVFDPDLEPSGVMPNATYEIRLDDPANYGAAGILSPYYITNNDTLVFSDLNDNSRDSDGTNPSPLIQVSDTNFPAVRLRTAGYGANDHTFDFGFALLPPTAPSVPAIQSTSGGGAITVTKSVNPPFAQPGSVVTWTITISNTSSLPVSPVIIDDPIPATLEILTSQITVSSATAVITVNGQVVNFNQPTMAAGEVVTVTIPTRIRPATGVPFIIVNEIPGFGDPARAQVVSASNLPDTGKAAWGGARIPLLGTAARFEPLRDKVSWDRRRIRNQIE